MRARRAGLSLLALLVLSLATGEGELVCTHALGCDMHAYAEARSQTPRLTQTDPPLVHCAEGSRSFFSLFADLVLQGLPFALPAHLHAPTLNACEPLPHPPIYPAYPAYPTLRTSHPAPASSDPSPLTRAALAGLVPSAATLDIPLVRAKVSTPLDTSAQL